jgi:leucyl aminopeptidase
MIHPDLPFLTQTPDAKAILGVRPSELEGFCKCLPDNQGAYVLGTGFRAAAGELRLLPAPHGVGAAVIGLGEDRSHHCFGKLARSLPEGAWRFEPGDFDMDSAILGFCLGAYAFTQFKPAARPPASLVVGEGHESVLAQAAAIFAGRDLINAPANVLGPTELADAAAALATRFGAQFQRIEGAALAAAYPTVAAVGAGSDRPPVVVRIDWAGSRAAPDAALVCLCGKGVVFDSGGYDLKPSSGMLRMKKDMGGAASMLALAQILMASDAPIRLVLMLGCVENSVSGHAMRPLDIIRTRRGLTVEIGNTDAEGRLVLCDLLAEASDLQPALLVDCATLTGAARVALGPDLPALFSNDDGWAEAVLRAGGEAHDPAWRLPLWGGYAAWLESPVADLNNVSGKSHAGAVTAALFLQRFVKAGTPWMHIDTYAWNDTSRPARPEGGEVMAMRALARAIVQRLASTPQTDPAAHLAST